MPSDRPEEQLTPFGKHQGKRLGDILDEDPKYLDFLLTIDIQKQSLRQAVEAMNEKYGGQIQAAIGD